MDADTITAKIPGHKGSSGNFVEIGQAAYIPPTSNIASIIFLPDDPKEKVIYSYTEADKHLGVFAIGYLTVYIRKLFFFKKKKLKILLNMFNGHYEIVESDFPVGSKVRFKVLFKDAEPRRTSLIPMKTLNITPEQKEDLFKFFSDDRAVLNIGERRFEKMTRDGVMRVEWCFITKSRYYPVDLSDFVSLTPTGN